ncbi:hypothetical protein Tco_0642693 [Tanacetum coccineum]
MVVLRIRNLSRLLMIPGDATDTQINENMSGPTANVTVLPTGLISSGPTSSSYARALIELRANVELKETIVDECPKNIVSDVAKNLKNPSQALRGVPVGHKVGFKTIKHIYRPLSRKNNANINGIKKKDAKSRKEVSNPNPFDVLNSVENDVDFGSSSTNTIPIIDKINKIERLIIDRKFILVDDEGKPLKKVYSLGDHDNEDEVEPVDNEMVNFLASKKVDYGTNSLLEQWKKTYENADYDYDIYDDKCMKAKKFLTTFNLYAII